MYTLFPASFSVVRMSNLGSPSNQRITSPSTTTIGSHAIDRRTSLQRLPRMKTLFQTLASSKHHVDISVLQSCSMDLPMSLKEYTVSRLGYGCIGLTDTKSNKPGEFHLLIFYSRYKKEPPPWFEELLEKLTVCFSGEELQFVETIYHKVIKLQVDFYSTQPIIQNTIDLG
ncbi:unnamed protein product [Lactuca saligna]|uniref:Uncharacterized protein n=1 Tax=Lactuca saligna TaxID=75948 RepID=A0AA35V805_LACSI|nr:unnamed protein product [Lactuca saligna]